VKTNFNGPVCNTLASSFNTFARHRHSILVVKAAHGRRYSPGAATEY